MSFSVTSIGRGAPDEAGDLGVGFSGSEIGWLVMTGADPEVGIEVVAEGVGVLGAEGAGARPLFPTGAMGFHMLHSTVKAP